MGSGDAVTFVATKKIAEDETAVIKFQLQDDEDPANDVAKTNISNANLTIYVEKGSAVLLTVADAKVFYNTDGLFRYVVPFAHNTIQSTASPKPTTEDHVVKIQTNFTVGSDSYRKTRNYRLTIQDNTLVP